jgi:hypothetical protein
MISIKSSIEFICRTFLLKNIKNKELLDHAEILIISSSMMEFQIFDFLDYTYYL